jgi:hypothetical protein
MTRNTGLELGVGWEAKKEGKDRQFFFKNIDTFVFLALRM